VARSTDRAARSETGGSADAPVVSIVIPSIGTAGHARGGERVFVVEAVRSVLATVQTPIEVLVVAGRDMPATVAAELEALDPAGRVRCVLYDAPFNFSATVNVGAAHARGEFVLLLNDDTEVIAPDWLERMVDAARGDGVGAVGARLLFDDGTLQHAGHTYRTSLDHVGFGLAGDAPGRAGLLTQRRPVAGATAACLLVPMHVYDLVGGFCTQFPGNYNDADFCLKVRAAGLTVVYEPAAALYHFESKSRVAGIRPEEIELIQRRWLTDLADDPYSPLVV
jgi:GT2 family glycosyltransferase